MKVSSMSLSSTPCFIERQFPVFKVSLESYAERRSNQAQSITSLGKWWGRKPLVLVRATLVALLLPSTDDPIKDRDIFLKLMTMDDEGLRRRKDKAIPGKRLIEELLLLPPSVQRRFFDENTPLDSPSIRRLSKNERFELQMLVFDSMSYSEKLQYCCRPEELDGPSESTWREINEHLGTSARTLPELVQELGYRRFGHSPKVGDAFCGAGSIPFESARLGFDTYGSDLSPVASLLTWAALNIVGGGQETIERVTDAQRRVYEVADQQLLEWGIDENEEGWRIDAQLFCSEVIDPETGWKVPLAAHWVIAPSSRVVATLVPDRANKKYDIKLIENATDEEIKIARESGTIVDGYVVHPILSELDKEPSSIDMIRASCRGLDSNSLYHESGLRLWEKDDFVPRKDDVFQERLYCIRWEEEYYEYYINENILELSKQEAIAMKEYMNLMKKGKLKKKTRRHYRSPNSNDINRERKVLQLIQDNFSEWQFFGLLPSRPIVPGDETARLQREKGWTYWHHLFTPRQLLIIGLLKKINNQLSNEPDEFVANLLSIGRFTDWNSKLCRWGTGAARESIGQTFTNQALNTLVNFASKGFGLASGTWFMKLNPQNFDTKSKIVPSDAREINENCDIWITDPPYADAINYHELSEYFLAWYEGGLDKLFPSWYCDSKRVKAVRGSGREFRQSMIDCYKRLVLKMPEMGLQIVMFTHQDARVWADLATILWAANLHVTAAWCIQTEREAAGVREGNYVQGTVLMVLRKRINDEPVFLDEINNKIESEVRYQLDTMLSIEDNSDPNFTDSDLQLAAYAAALRVLTERPIEEIDPSREILKGRVPGEIGQVEILIRNAVKIACDHLVPKGIEREIWKTFNPIERFYIKGLEIETHGEYRSGVFQELARGFGATSYTDLIAESKANATRLKTAGEFGKRMLSGDGFASSLMRQILFSIHQINRNEDIASGLNWIKTEIPDYWNLRDKIIHILDFFGNLDQVSGMAHWEKDSEAARLLAGAVRNDHI